MDRFARHRRRSLAFLSVSILAVVCLAGCGGDRGQVPITEHTLLAEVGPKCEALRASNDPESAAYIALLDFVYQSEDGIGTRYASLTRAQKMLWATRLFEDEINNGGLNQYFYNTLGASLDDAIRGFDAFGARGHATVAREARKIFATDKERIEDVRDDGTIEGFSESYDDEPYEALDEKFVELGSPPGRTSYLKAHLREFCVP